jgi:hypothetical protein
MKLEITNMPLTLKVQAAISPHHSAAVDEVVVEAIGLYGPEVLAPILEHKGAVDIKCVYQSQWLLGIRILDYVIKSPMHEVAVVGVVEGSAVSVQMQTGLPDERELIPVETANESSLTVKIVKNRITWGHAPLFSARDGSEFRICGKDFNSLCCYLNWFDTSFNQYCLTMHDIEAILRSGEDSNE